MFGRVLNTSLVELAPNPLKPKNYQKAEIWSRCSQHHEEKKREREKRKKFLFVAGGKSLKFMSDFTQNIQI